MRLPRMLAAVVTAGVLAVSLASCARLGSAVAKEGQGTFTFGTAGAPTTFDPFYAGDADTFRITRQIFETLVTTKPGSADIQPGLATRWKPDSTGTVWTFRLRKGVRFTDGKALDSSAVCANLDRMFDQNVAGQSAATYWNAFFGGFKADAEKDTSLYRSCQAPGATTAVVTIARATGSFPAMLSLPAFAIQSPRALTTGDANGIRSAGTGYAYPANSARPVGTGPFRLKRYDQATGTVTLTRNEDYWGPHAASAKLVFKVLPEDSARRQALEAGTINGYDLPSPVDWKGLEAEGFQVRTRAPFNLLYVGLNLGHNKLLRDLRVRQAMYYAIDRQRLVTAQLPKGASVATQFVPSTVGGFDASLAAYGHDPAKAKSLLKAAKAKRLSVTFAYPSDVSRSYMPDPAVIYDSLRTDLQSVGIKVKIAAVPSAQFQAGVLAGKYDAYLTGWSGDFDDPYNFLGSLFANPARNGFHTAKIGWGKKLATDLLAADATVGTDARLTKYQQVNHQIMTKYLPGLPISSSPSAIVVDGTVKGLTPSPTGAESFASVTAAQPKTP